MNHKRDGEDHKYKPTSTSPKCFTKMMCEDCGQERPLTEEERVSLQIETIEEYRKSLTVK